LAGVCSAVGWREAIHLRLYISVYGGTTISSPLDGVRPSRDRELRSCSAAHVAGGGLGAGVEGLSAPARPADEPLEQGSSAQDQRDPQLAGERHGLLVAAVQGPLGRKLVPRAYVDGGHDEVSRFVCERLCDGLDSLEAPPLDGEAHPRNAISIVCVDHPSAPAGIRTSCPHDGDGGADRCVPGRAGSLA
jgi:hypothetical protein